MFDNINAQEVGFSQFYSNELFLNPALCGSKDGTNLCLNYRNQWPGIKKAYSTFSASFDTGIERMNSGIGLNIIKDDQGNGTISLINASGIYSYHVNLSHSSSLKIGIKLSYIQWKINYNELIFPDMLGSSNPATSSEGLSGSSISNIFDAGFGVVFGNKKYFAGIAIDHLNQATVALSNYNMPNYPMKFTLHVGGIWTIGKHFFNGNLKISPNILYLQQKGFNQLSIGSYLIYKNFTTGVWVRNNLSLDYDALIFLLGFTQSRFKIGYSFDLTISKLLKQGFGAHEISLQIYFENPQKSKKLRAISCPEF